MKSRRYFLACGTKPKESIPAFAFTGAAGEIPNLVSLLVRFCVLETISVYETDYRNLDFKVVAHFGRAQHRCFVTKRIDNS